MDGGTRPAALGGLAAFTPLASELGDLKRVRDASSPDSLAVRAFRRAWGRLAAGEDARVVALTAGGRCAGGEPAWRDRTGRCWPKLA